MPSQEGYQRPFIKCSVCGKESKHRSHKHGTHDAHNEGWFFQKDGKVFCPDDLPEWLEEWRKKQNALH